MIIGLAGRSCSGKNIISERLAEKGFCTVLWEWKRDRRPLKDILKRFAAQKELKSQYFLSGVDTYIIRNGLFRSVLYRRVDKWVKYLLPER